MCPHSAGRSDFLVFLQIFIFSFFSPFPSDNRKFQYFTRSHFFFFYQNFRKFQKLEFFFIFFVKSRNYSSGRHKLYEIFVNFSNFFSRIPKNTKNRPKTTPFFHHFFSSLFSTFFDQNLDFRPKNTPSGFLGIYAGRFNSLLLPPLFTPKNPIFSRKTRFPRSP